VADAPGGSRLKRQPFSRTGENPQSGMLGGIVETSASFEARSAPRSYPTGSSSGYFFHQKWYPYRANCQRRQAGRPPRAAGHQN
jgi:hypothetical protein